MSTRCTIHVEQANSSFKILYHHHDGYLSGVGKALFDLPKAKRTNLEEIKKAIERRFSRSYVWGNYEDEKFSLAQPRLEHINTGKDPLYIEWRYRILKDGTLEVDHIGRTDLTNINIKTKKQFEMLVKSTEKHL